MAEKDREVVALPIYIVVEEDAVVLPQAKVEIVTPSELPTEGRFYALTSEGMKISKDTGLINALVPAKTCGFLAEVDIPPKLGLPKIPPLVTTMAFKFFRMIYQKYHTESEVMLLYNKAKKQYDLWCPKQEVSMAGVKYDMSEELAGTPTDWQWIGTYHSHANFGAYHSNVDHDDEQDEDGVHITIGDVGGKAEAFTISASVMIGGERWTLPVQNILLGVKRLEDKEAKRKYHITTSWKDDFYAIELSPQEQTIFDEDLMPRINEEWYPRVEHKTWTGRSVGFATGSSSYAMHQDEYDFEDEYEFEEEDENGEWTLVNGHWDFVEDEAKEEEEEYDDGDQGEFDPADFETYTDPNGVIGEDEKDKAIAADAALDSLEDEDDDADPNG
jgi:proteasome lid subunit RPN8/RPN11